MCEEQIMTGSMEEMDLFNPQTDRDLYLNNQVDNFTISRIVKKINKINNWYQKYCDQVVAGISELIKTETIKLNDSKVQVLYPPTEPIRLHVSSFGGSVYDGITLINVMKNSLVPVDTYVDGHAMSMGLIIALAGDTRYGYKNSTWMYHCGSSWNIGTFTDQKRQIIEQNRIQKILDDVVTENSLIEQDYLEDLKNSIYDWYFDGIEALELGVADVLLDYEEDVCTLDEDNEEYIGACDFCGKDLAECECDD